MPTNTNMILEISEHTAKIWLVPKSTNPTMLNRSHNWKLWTHAVSIAPLSTMLSFGLSQRLLESIDISPIPVASGSTRNPEMIQWNVSNWSFFTSSHTPATTSNRQHECEGHGGHCKVFSSRVGKCGFSSVTSKSEGGTHQVFIAKNITATSNHSDLHSTTKKRNQIEREVHLNADHPVARSAKGT